MERITSKRLTQCFRCNHYLEKKRCKAFPEKNIPKGYLYGTVNHSLVLGNQKGNYTYEVNQKYREQEERYKASDAVAVQELEENKKELPRVIIERIKKRQIDLRKLKKVVVSASGPLRSKFDLSMEFYPAEMTIENLAISSFKYESKSILKGLEALNKKSSFILEIYGEKEWKYIFDENFLW